MRGGLGGFGGGVAAGAGALRPSPAGGALRTPPPSGPTLKSPFNSAPPHVPAISWYAGLPASVMEFLLPFDQAISISSPPLGRTRTKAGLPRRGGAFRPQKSGLLPEISAM